LVTVGFVICVAGADGAGAVPWANAGAVSMLAASSAAVNVFNIVFFLLWRSRRDAGLALMPWIMPIGNERGLRGTDTRRSYR
jgi:hypothetical protein